MSTSYGPCDAMNLSRIETNVGLIKSASNPKHWSLNANAMARVVVPTAPLIAFCLKFCQNEQKFSQKFSITFFAHNSKFISQFSRTFFIIFQIYFTNYWKFYNKYFI